MNENKVSNCPKCKEPGKRVFVNPNVAFQTKIDPHDIKQMVRKTDSLKGSNVGELWDMAAEASEKRGGENDPIRKKAELDYAKQRKGKKYRGGSKANTDAFKFRVGE